MVEVPVVKVEATPDFGPIMMRCKASNPPDKQYELWVIEEDGRQYYLHGSYRNKETMFRVAEIVGRSRAFTEMMLADVFQK